MKKTALIMLFFLALLFALKVQSVYSQTETNEVVATKKTDSSSIQLPENKTVVDDAVGHYKIPDTTKPTETNIVIKSSGNPDYLIVTKGYFLMREYYYDAFHSMMESGYRNDQIPRFMFEENNWLNDSTTGKPDVKLSPTKKIKFRDEWYYVCSSPRNLYHPDVYFEFCITVAPGVFLPEFAVHKNLANMDDVIVWVDKFGVKHYNYKIKPVELTKDELKDLRDALGEE